MAPPPKPAVDPADHVAPIEESKSQLTAGLDHSDPAHPDYGKDDPPPPAEPSASEKPAG